MFAFRMAAAVGFCAALAAAPGLARADCKLLQVAEFKLDPTSYAPIVEGSINGQAVKVLIDSGAAFSMVTRHDADRLHLPKVEMETERAYGIGGDTQVYRAHIGQLTVGPLTKTNLDLFVAGDRRQPGPATVVLGDDVLSKVDVEFDLPDHAIRLFQPQGCASAQLVYWGAAYSQAAMALPDPRAPAIQAYASLNGKPILAELDSGAEFSVIDVMAADADGVERLARARSGDVRGMGPRPEESSTGRVDSFALGDEKIAHLNIQVVNITRGMSYVEPGGSNVVRLENTPSMFIGDDFLHAHRVLIDNKDRLILFSYQGGPVFGAPPSPPQSAPQAAAPPK